MSTINAHHFALFFDGKNAVVATALAVHAFIQLLHHRRGVLAVPIPIVLQGPSPHPSS